ncbi:MAG: PAS domain S-box protein [Acidimicrobiia bacterium]|nr:PAS domain S-box protein [Acidimicrobiia bacterium]
MSQPESSGDERAPDTDESEARAAVRRRARQRLRRAQTLVEHSSDILFIVDAAGNPIYMSPRAGEVLGYAQDRPLGKSTLDLLHPDDVEATAEALALVMSGGLEHESLVVRTRTVDGGYRHLELRARSFLDDPDVEGVLVSARDLTDQKRAEDDLRRSEQRFRTVVQNSSDMIIVIDAAATISYVSPSSLRILGRSDTDLVGTNALDLVHPDDLEAVARRLKMRIEEGGPHEPTALRVLHADGRWIDIEVVSNNLLDDEEVRGVVVNVRDITERVRMTAALEHAQKRLVDSFEHAAVGMAILDLQGNYARVNAALCEMLGHAEAELLGSSFAAVTHPDYVDRVVSSHEEAAARGNDTYELEKQYLHRDGHAVWARLAITVVRDDEGDPEYYLSQAIDVTAQKELEKRLAHEAVHDHLTGLPTRPLLFDRLDQALAAARRSSRQVGVLFVDLDGFKLVNDSLGHAAGDDVLIAVARRLRSAVREVDTPARFGGDEFVVICPDIAGIADAIGIAERIREALEAGIPVSGTEVTIGASVGIAIADGSAAGDALLREADSATYGVKRRGGGTWELAVTTNCDAAPPDGS